MKFDKLMELHADDLVYRTITAFEAPSTVVTSEFEGAFVTPQTFPVYSLDRSTLLPGYMALLTTSPTFHEDMSSRCVGTVLRRKTLSKGAFESIPIALPPLAEQRRIVDLIAAVDDAIEAVDGEVASIVTIVRSLLDSLFPQDNGLETVPLGAIAALTDCEHKTAPATAGSPFAYSVGTPAVRDGSLVMSAAKPVSETTYREWSARTTPAPGDIIFTREAPAGEVALLTADDPLVCLGQRTVLLRGNEQFMPSYLWLALQAPRTGAWIESRSMGQTVKRINISAIKELPIVTRTLDEQALVVTTVRSAIEHRIAARATADALRTLRSNLLTVLLSGEHEIPSSYDQFLNLDEEVAA
ncbi:restriction endonuclease subunit S [Microbacterium sp. ISL-59]|uniref:restriction endonuclease subunit S n=1 Tax=Microbacterium sp. ISL-59 TaxID=2819159 RepID=UPI001BEC4ED8|nr:restriction endonuclease subunit S [Microbacterium sp. ISL-59]MBT2495694.1 restriction endonuclease subunit S [Microbacterium sp. ISL-59]